MFVLPQYRNKGIAQKAITEVENIHGNDNWELDTILQEKTIAILSVITYLLIEKYEEYQKKKVQASLNDAYIFFKTIYPEMEYK